jgi:hypothetical protein
MPTVHQQDGFQFRIYPNDHDPAHVHAWKAGRVAKIGLGDDETAPYPMDPGAMRTPDVRRAIRIVEEHQATLLNEWRKHHA